MSTIAPKLSEFAMNTYSFPCNRVTKEKNAIMLMHENSGSSAMGAEGNPDQCRPVRVANRAFHCSSVMGRYHHGQEGT